MKMHTVPVGHMQTNCYFVTSEEGNTAVIDPGADGAFIIKKLAQLGLKPVMILLTHAHYDHTGAIKELRAHFGEIPLSIGTGDVDMLSDTNISLGGRFGSDRSNYEGITHERELVDGDTIELDEVEIKAIATPGHTKGGICYVVEDCIFSGDTLFRREVGRCDLFGGSFDAIKLSIANLYKLPGNYGVYPGHGDSSTLDEERAENPYVKG